MAKTQAQTSETKMEVFTTNRGSKYNVPAKYAKATSFSEVIRAMKADGYTTGQIAKTTNALYQHVRNVLAQPPKKV